MEDPHLAEVTKLMDEARAKEEKGSRSSAMSMYEKIARKYPNSVYAAEALFRAAKIRQERRQYTKAFTQYEEVIRRYPNSPHFDEVIAGQFNIAKDLLDGKRPYYWGWLPGFRARTDGINYMARVVINAPYSPFAPQALLLSAKGYIEDGQTEMAIDALDHLINSYSDSPYVTQAYMDLAKAYAELVQGPEYDLATTKLSESYYEDYIILFPNAPELAAAEKGRDEMRSILARNKLNTGDFYLRDKNNLHAARVFYNEAITAYPGSDIEKLARERLEMVRQAEIQRNIRSENRISIGDYYYNRGYYDAALIFYTEAAAIKPSQEIIDKAKARINYTKKVKNGEDPNASDDTAPSPSGSDPQKTLAPQGAA